MYKELQRAQTFFQNFADSGSSLKSQIKLYMGSHKKNPTKIISRAQPEESKSERSKNELGITILDALSQKGPITGRPIIGFELYKKGA